VKGRFESIIIMEEHSRKNFESYKGKLRQDCEKSSDRTADEDLSWGSYGTDYSMMSVDENPPVKKKELGITTASYVGTEDDEVKHTRRIARTLVENERFQLTIIALIAINSILMGVATFDFVSQNDSITKSFERVDSLILIIFTAELALNLYAYGSSFFYDSWLLFDLVSIVLSWVFATFTIIRSFRIFRAFRLFAKIDSLKKIIQALTSTSEQMLAILFVLGILFYIFAVMFTQLFGDCYEEGCYAEDENSLGINYFGRLDYTMFTLFMLMSMENWSDIIRMTDSRYPWSWIPLLTFMVVSAFVMLNLVIAVLCEALSALKDDDEEVNNKRQENNSKQQDIENEIRESEISRQHQTLTAAEMEIIIREQSQALLKINRRIDEMQTAFKSMMELQLVIAKNLNKG